MLRLGIPVALAAFGLDQLSKWYVWSVLEIAQRPRPRVLPFVDLVLVWNPGISFGLLQSDSALAPVLLSLFALVVSIGLLVWMKRTHSALLGVALGLAVGGALGNAVDRVRWGHVLDFVYVHFGWFSWWPVFNVADTAITVGFCLIVLDGLLVRRRQAI
ncbi:MAG: signal peptidase [Pseudomonadota bacterium]